MRSSTYTTINGLKEKVFLMIPSNKWVARPDKASHIFMSSQQTNVAVGQKLSSFGCCHEGTTQKADKTKAKKS
uniref:Uncharacterized protein n=1 Tax=Trichogramma kaykai TaxID=54128 RepID=A0ABD2WRN2_9HYME